MDRADTLEMDTGGKGLDDTIDMDAAAATAAPAPDARWGRLVPTHDAPQLDLKGPGTTLGRFADCDVVIDDKRCSKRHARVLWDAAAGRAAIEDLSTNGTFVNGTKVGKGNTVPLNNYDEIVLVRAKGSDPTDAEAIGFVFVLKLSKSETGSFAPDPLAHTTPQKATPLKADPPAAGTDGTDGADGADGADGDERPVKRARTTTDAAPAESNENTKEKEEKKVEDAGANGKTSSSSTDDVPAPPAAASTTAAAATATGGDGDGDDDDESEPERTAIEQNMTCPICDDLLYKCVSILPCMHSYCAACWSDWAKRSVACPSCRVTATTVRRNHQLNNLVEEYIKANPSKQRPEEELKEMDARNTITAEELRVSVPRPQFDSDEEDYDDGYSSSGPTIIQCRECPSFPSNQGAPAAVGGAAAVAAVPPASASATASSTSSSSSSSSPSSATAGASFAPHSCPSVNAMHVRCRYCSDYVPEREFQTARVPPPPVQHNPNALPTAPIAFKFQQPNPTTAGAGGTNDGGAGGTGAAAPAAPADPADPDPSKRPLHWQTGGLDPQSEDYARQFLCGVCQVPVCTGYFPDAESSKPGFHARLRRIRDHVPTTFPAQALAVNRFERKVLTDYIAAKGVSLADIVAKYADEVGVRPEDKGPGEWLMIGWPGLHPDQKVCTQCFNKIFADMLLAFRRDIPKDELPDELARRRDCWYGWQCRTMRHNMDHATRMNHMCKNTR